MLERKQTRRGPASNSRWEKQRKKKKKDSERNAPPAVWGWLIDARDLGRAGSDA